MATADTTLKDLETRIRAILLPMQVVDGAGNPAHRVYRGQPMPEGLNADLQKRIVHVAIVMAPSGEARSEGGTSSMQQVTEPDVQLSATATATKFVGTPVAVTLAGTVVAGTRLMVQVGPHYLPYQPATGATPIAVAAAVAAAVNADPSMASLVTAAAVGATVTFTNNAAITIGGSFAFDFRIGGTADFMSSTRWGKTEFHVHVFGYDDNSRAAYANAIDDILSDIRMVSLSDGTTGKLEYVRFLQTDRELSHLAYRRTLVYSVQYNRTALTTGYQVLAGLVNFMEGN